MKMTTPIKDFVDSYAEKSGVRAHMPGHKGKMLTGCEKWDITEIKGADFLYGAEGIIAQSEKTRQSFSHRPAPFTAPRGHPSA